MPEIQAGLAVDARTRRRTAEIMSGKPRPVSPARQAADAAADAEFDAALEQAAVETRRRRGLPEPTEPSEPPEAGEDW